ncbi:rCG38529 [Rattus norvegicus]|uniref:RCG38529 n=1 Tax=Rattus norvegicus TaxID=10116 RepID=A6KMD6_RAT|nr:rCG38529 [Rattus norvegicus]
MQRESTPGNLYCSTKAHSVAAMFCTWAPHLRVLRCVVWRRGKRGKLELPGTLPESSPMTVKPEKTRLKLPSGSKVIFSAMRAIAGVVASGGRIDRLNSGYHEDKANRKCWACTQGLALSTADHPFGGGNHPCISKPSNI